MRLQLVVVYADDALARACGIQQSIPAASLEANCGNDPDEDTSHSSREATMEERFIITSSKRDLETEQGRAPRAIWTSRRGFAQRDS